MYAREFDKHTVLSVWNDKTAQFVARPASKLVCDCGARYTDESADWEWKESYPGEHILVCIKCGEQYEVASTS